MDFILDAEIWKIRVLEISYVTLCYCSCRFSCILWPPNTAPWHQCVIAFAFMLAWAIGDLQQEVRVRMECSSIKCHASLKYKLSHSFLPLLMWQYSTIFSFRAPDFCLCCPLLWMFIRILLNSLQTAQFEMSPVCYLDPSYATSHREVRWLSQDPS